MLVQRVLNESGSFSTVVHQVRPNQTVRKRSVYRPWNGGVSGCLLPGRLRVFGLPPPELIDEIEMHQVEMHADPKKEQSHPDEDEWHENSVDGARNTVETIGNPPDEREEEGPYDDREARLHEPRVSSDLSYAILDLGRTG